MNFMIRNPLKTNPTNTNAERRGRGKAVLRPRWAQDFRLGNRLDQEGRMPQEERHTRGQRAGNGRR